MPAPPRHPTPPFNNLHPHDRKNTAVMGISISHMRNQSSGNHPGEQISSLHCVSINNTTIYSNEPVRVRPNPRPQKGVVRSGLVWFRKTKATKTQNPAKIRPLKNWPIDVTFCGLFETFKGHYLGFPTRPYF